MPWAVMTARLWRCDGAKVWMQKQILRCAKDDRKKGSSKSTRWGVIYLTG